MAAQAEYAEPFCCMGRLYQNEPTDLVANICNKCLWRLRCRNGDAFLLPGIWKPHDIPPQYLYMVLSSNDDLSKGLNAKDKSGLKSVNQHMSSRNKSWYASQYISTFTSLESADRFAKDGIIYDGSPEPQQIVEIDVSRLQNATFIKISNETLPQSQWQYMGYTSISDDVLIVGHIPPNAITAIYYSDRSELTCTCKNTLMLDRESNLVVNICAKCLKILRMNTTDEETRLYQLSHHVSVLGDIEEKHSFLYRVLKTNDDVSYGLVAKNESECKSIKEHVAFGSRTSQYISTCTSLEMAKEFADKGIKHGDPLPKRIVEIDVSKLLATTTFIDLENYETRKALLSHITDMRAYNFANKYKEVLVVGRIPAYAITEKYRKWSVEDDLELYN